MSFFFVPCYTNTSVIYSKEIWLLKGTNILTSYHLVDTVSSYASTRVYSAEVPYSNLYSLPNSGLNIQLDNHEHTGIVVLGTRLIQRSDMGSALPFGKITFVDDDDVSQVELLNSDIGSLYVELVYDFSNKTLEIYKNNSLYKTINKNTHLKKLTISNNQGISLAFADCYVIHSTDPVGFGRIGPIVIKNFIGQELIINGSYINGANWGAAVSLSSYNAVKSFFNKEGTILFEGSELTLKSLSELASNTLKDEPMDDLQIYGFVASQYNHASHFTPLNSTMSISDKDDNTLISKTYEPQIHNQLLIRNESNTPWVDSDIRKFTYKLTTSLNSPD